MSMGTPSQVVILPPGDGPLEILDVEIPEPEAYQVVVREYASGICHTQISQIHGPRDANIVLGHEATGVVLKTGSEVTYVQEDDTVLVTWVPRAASETSRLPQHSQIELPDGSVAASRNIFTWSEVTIIDEQFVVKVDPDIDKEVTSIIGCAVMTGAGAVENTAGVKAGESVAIFGVGGVGLSAVASARNLGAEPIIAVDLDQEKLEFARRFGATHTINASKEDPIAAIKALTQRDRYCIVDGLVVSGADYTFDCIGGKKTMDQILAAARTGYLGGERGGTAVLVGIPFSPAELDVMDLLFHEKKFIGSVGGSCSPGHEFPKYLDWHDSGKLDLNVLVTARYSIDEINEASRALAEGEISGRAILVF